MRVFDLGLPSDIKVTLVYPSGASFQEWICYIVKESLKRHGFLLLLAK